MGEFIDEELFKERLQEAFALKKLNILNLSVMKKKSLKNIKNMLKLLHQWYVIQLLF